MTQWGPTWLFVPGDRPLMFEKAASSGADQVLLDLEDAVGEDHKTVAREAVTAWLDQGREAWVRVNGAGTPWHEADLALGSLPGVSGFVLPKSESARAVEHVSASLGGGGPVMVLVETALGVLNLQELAGADGTAVLALGSVDLATDLGCEHAHEPLLHARSAMVVASRGARLPPPVDGVTVETRDAAVAGDDARRAAGLGFGGKLCIHPAQLAPVAAAFQPTPDQVAWARRIVTVTGGASCGVSVVDGQMVDRPIVERALRILARSGGPEE